MTATEPAAEHVSDPTGSGTDAPDETLEVGEFEDYCEVAGVELPPAIPDLVARVRAYYALPGNEAGGNLHVALDDDNLDAHYLVWCLGRCVERGDEPGKAIALALLDMSIVERQWFTRSFYPYYSGTDRPRQR
jgi:hypothetical protein